MIANKEFHIIVDRKQLHNEDMSSSLNSLVNVFKPKLRLNPIKRLLFKILSNNTCKSNNRADLNSFDNFEQTFTVSVEKHDGKLNNRQMHYDFTSCSLNPNEIMITKKTMVSSLNPWASSFKPNQITLSSIQHNAFKESDDDTYLDGNNINDASDRHQEDVMIHEVINKQHDVY